jgi:hypothetical protein
MPHGALEKACLRGSSETVHRLRESESGSAAFSQAVTIVGMEMSMGVWFRISQVELPMGRLAPAGTTSERRAGFGAPRRMRCLGPGLGTGPGDAQPSETRVA